MKKNSTISYIIVLVVVAALIFVSIRISKTQQNGTNEAKQPPIVVEGWENGVDAKTGIKFMYPAAIDTTYVSLVAQTWPPQFNKVEDPFACVSTELEAEGMKFAAEGAEYNGTSYCVATITEGAAGSSYINYVYAKAIDSGTIMLTFTLQYPQCLNYDEPEQSTCKTEEDSFDPIELADKIFSTADIK